MTLFCRERGCSARLQLPPEDVPRGVREPPQRPQERADLLLQVLLSVAIRALNQPKIIGAGWLA